MRSRSRRLDLQAKISLVLAAVIVPTFLVVTVVENQLIQPILEEDFRQTGIHFGKTLAAEMVGARLLSLPHPTPVIENLLQERLYLHPTVVRIDVIVKDSTTGLPRMIASNIEDDPNTLAPTFVWSDALTSEFKMDEGEGGLWDIYVPIEHRSRDVRAPKKILGMVHVIVSTKLVGRMATTLWKITAAAAALSVVSLIAALSYFLRKTIANDRLLRKAEVANLQLTEQLHEAQRQLMTTEKLAVMGQLTASFAHEIGTPLNAIGGHLQLLKEEIPTSLQNAVVDRLEVVNGQVAKIEEIVKGFLQNTAKPPSQKQLIDLNRLVEKTLSIVTPRTESLRIDIKRQLNRGMGPVRVVPLDLEQILLNLLNNSLDSIQAKSKQSQGARAALEISTKEMEDAGRQWAVVSIFDTGEGIRKVDLQNVLKPFFTTKRPGEGTGLGLTICQQLAQKYGGELGIDSKEGAWTRVTIKLPYHANA